MAGQRPRGRPPHPDQLTPTEWHIVNGVRHGLTNAMIARLRGVSIDAVKYHVANILQKLEFSRRMDLRGWGGIAADSALLRTEKEMNQQHSLGTIGQVSRTVRDIAAATEYYRDKLGLPHLYSFGNLAFFDCGGLRLFLSEGEGGAAESILYFRVDDIHGSIEALAGRGVEVTHAPHMIHRHDNGDEEWMAFFKDNEDRPLAIMAQVANG